MRRSATWKHALICAAVCAALVWTAIPASAAAPRSAKRANSQTESNPTLFTERKALFERLSLVTGVPWTILAALDQYERTIALAKKKPLPERLSAVLFTEEQWCGLLNPDRGDTSLPTIAFFGGLGRDGDGDGKADRNNDTDTLIAMAQIVTRKRTSPDDLAIGLWEYYQNTRSVERIMQFAEIYGAFGTLDLHKHAFPLPLKAEYSYRSTWGASRGWGGFRIHEGTDLFAGYGVPARSTCYGIVEEMGWNDYGGWRIGIRDLNNVYHYYAHLSGFNKKEVHKGSLVIPGQTIGWVGSSGYGKPGTSGKFPPHLHYGLYRDNGLTEWSFDPYPYLRRWEREERLRGKPQNG
ncbi:MAG: M23 family metallopeptidase [Paenibacillaceae bacterium]|nr:M23 family metallopeptidase [Paenibacillaceae bacterium]